jgi:uncharacterized membrane protein
LVHLPIALVVFSVLADLLARLVKVESRRATLRTLGFWSLVAGLAGGVLTIGAGYLDLRRAELDPRVKQLVGLHVKIGWTLAICLIALTTWRWLIWHRGQMTINTSYLVAGFAVLALTLFQGWYGSEMVYSHGAGVAAAGQGTERPHTAQGRLLAIHDLLQPGAPMGAGDSPGGTNDSGSIRSE